MTHNDAFSTAPGLLLNFQKKAFRQWLKRNIYVDRRGTICSKVMLIAESNLVSHLYKKHLKFFMQSICINISVLINTCQKRVQYSVLWRGFSNRRRVVSRGLKPSVSSAKLEWQFLHLFARKNPGDKIGFHRHFWWH